MSNSLIRRLLFALALVAVTWIPASAQGQLDCSGNKELALLDFWFGDWRVEDEVGNALGSNSIFRLLNGCVIQERWQGVGGGVGVSLFYVNPETSRLKQVWVTGQALSPGGTKEKEVIASELGQFVQFQGSYPNGDARVLDRTTLTRQEDGSILQLIEISQDDGASWQSTLIVLNKSGHDASFIDLASGEIIATLPTGRGPHELIVTSDGRWAIGTDYSGGNSLTVFDVTELEVERTIDLSDYSRPHGIVFLPGEEQVLVTSEGSGNLVAVNFHTGEIETVISTRPHSSHMVAISEDGRVAYTVNGSSNSVSVVDMATASLTRDYPVPDRPEAINTNKAGSEIWVGSNDDEVVTVLDAETGRQLAQWDGFSWPYRVLFTEDERYVVMPDLGNESLRFFDAQGKTELGRMELTGTRS
ncbi:unnamed protein product [Symbiodinium microadriaticum]|nr:unnamed protein product [Symbiodinium microadriaticum]